MCFSPIKEINRLLSKDMSNIYIKVTKFMFSKLPFSKFKKFVSRSDFGELQLMQISLNFQIFLLPYKNKKYGSKTVCGISIILVSKGFITLSSKNFHAFEQIYKL